MKWQPKDNIISFRNSFPNNCLLRWEDNSVINAFKSFKLLVKIGRQFSHLLNNCLLKWEDNSVNNATVCLGYHKTKEGQFSQHCIKD